MKHLTNDEILNYVSFDTLDDENMKLASDVVLHIRQCKECLKKVNAFQNIYFQMLDSDRSEELAKLAEDFINGDDVDEVLEPELKLEQEKNLEM